MATITVSAAFVADFKYLCEHDGLTRFEEQALRESIRADFETMGPWVTETVRLYRFMHETWLRLPRPEWCRGYMASRGFFPADDSVFQRFGIMLLVRMCAEIAGVIPLRLVSGWVPQVSDSGGKPEASA